MGIYGNEAVCVWELGKDDVGEYVALSHHFVSKTKNIDWHRRNINLGKLPATICDAIFTTRKVGKRYPCTDSICILQGKGEDFGLEAG